MVYKRLNIVAASIRKVIFTGIVQMNDTQDLYMLPDDVFAPLKFLWVIFELGHFGNLPVGKVMFSACIQDFISVLLPISKHRVVLLKHMFCGYTAVSFYVHRYLLRSEWCDRHMGIVLGLRFLHC